MNGIGPRPTLRDFGGAQVWVGLVVSLGGFLAQDWPSSINFGPLMFFGGLLVGLGVMHRACSRYCRGLTNRTQQPAGAPSGDGG
jgi:hypothetical protein